MTIRGNVPRRVLFTSIAAVGSSTIFLPFVTGYGTILYQIVVLNAWGIVAKVSSGRFADLHHRPVWLVALFLNLAFFLILALPIYRLAKNRLPLLSVIAVVSWTLFYLGSLFVLFPATDGP